MIKLIYTLGLTVLLGGMANAAESYTCATPPSCADLGYTLTSTANCVGTVLKCPFDTSKYYCTQKDVVVNMLAPNYKAPKELQPNGTTYTVGSGDLVAYSCGWVLFRSEETNGYNTFTPPISEWYINDKRVGGQKGVDGKWADYNTAIFFVTKNDTFRLRGTALSSLDFLYFYPCKGY